MQFALEQTTELETSIAPSIFGCCRDPRDPPSMQESRGLEAEPSRTHLIPGFFIEPGQKIATLMVEILVKATLITSVALGRDDPVCTTFSSKNDSAAENIY